MCNVTINMFSVLNSSKCQLYVNLLAYKRSFAVKASGTRPINKSRTEMFVANQLIAQ